VRAGSQPVGWGPRLDGVSPYQGSSAKFPGRATLCEASLPVNGIGPRWLRWRLENPKFII
jgi:hypothetical protein